MAQKQPTTFKRKLGEDDLDRISEIHDQIVDWVTDNCAGIVNEVLGKQIEAYFAEREYRLYTTRRAIGGFDDLHTEMLDKSAYEPFTICFEIKSQISQTGFLFRQLNWYKELYGFRIPFIIISPDERHRRKIEEEGYRFFKYEDGTLPIPSTADRQNRINFDQKCGLVYNQYLNSIS